MPPHETLQYVSIVSTEQAVENWMLGHGDYPAIGGDELKLQARDRYTSQ